MGNLRSCVIDGWRIYKMILENPYYLFEMIDYAFYSDNPEIRKQEEEMKSSDKQRKIWAKFSGKMLYSLDTMPCMAEDGTIDEKRLKDYIFTLRRLGEEKEKMSMVNHTIGKLLASYSTCTNGCPPEIICDIIEDLNSTEVNDGFHAQIYNTLGFTVRGPFDGGDIEHNRAAKFYETAEKIQVMYPITAGICFPPPCKVCSSKLASTLTTSVGCCVELLIVTEGEKFRRKKEIRLLKL